MAKFKISGTHETPSVLIDDKKGAIEIKGRSTVQDPVHFYSSIVEKLNRCKYSAHLHKYQFLKMDLSYFPQFGKFV